MQKTTLWYWFLPMIAFIFQAVYTFSSMNQIRYEEVIEIFRNAWWFQNRLVWNGSYAFVGWYTLLTTTYNIFGISLYTPKFIKLGIELISFFCLADVLKRYLGKKLAWLPFLAITLSPTFMFFNSLQLSMGLEVSFFFIVLFLITRLDFKPKLTSLTGHLFVWFIAMFAWLTYFGFIFYIPFVLSAYVYKLLASKSQFSWKLLLVSAAGFLSPLLIVFLYIDNNNLLIYDPLLGRGLFRSFGTFEVSLNLLKDTLSRIFSDLFNTGTSYYFEVKKGEFSDYYPVISIFAVITVAIIIYIKKKFRILILLLSLGILIYFTAIGLMGPKTLGGIRRGTAILVLFYGLFSLAWYCIFSLKIKPIYRFAYVLSLSLILLHHIIVFPANLNHLKQPSIFREQWFFSADNPERVYAGIVSEVQRNDILFECRESHDKLNRCPGSSLILSITQASCFWNNLKCYQVTAYDKKTQKYFPLTFGFWGKEPHAEP